MILADTSVWIDLLRDNPTPAMLRLRDILADGGEGLLMGDLILFEILQGTRDEKHAHMMEERLGDLECITISDRMIASHSAAYYRNLRIKGVTVRKTVDILIATRCIADRHAVLFSDRDFQPFVEHLGLIDAMTL